MNYCPHETIWESLSTPGNNGDDWSVMRVNLVDEDSSDYKLILEGTIPAGKPNASICVDDIQTFTVPCEDLEPKKAANGELIVTRNNYYYFIYTFIGALCLGLILPCLVLMCIILICRRRFRHELQNGHFGNSKLFSTNLWYYIGGDRQFDDPMRNLSTMPKPAAMMMENGMMYGQNGDNFMDLPDVVMPSGRVTNKPNSNMTMNPNDWTMRQQTMNATMGRNQQFQPQMNAMMGMQNGNPYMTMGRQTMDPNGQNPWMNTQTNMMASQYNPGFTQQMSMPLQQNQNDGNNFFRALSSPQGYQQQPLPPQPQQATNNTTSTTLMSNETSSSNGRSEKDMKQRGKMTMDTEDALALLASVTNGNQINQNSNYDTACYETMDTSNQPHLPPRNDTQPTPSNNNNNAKKLAERYNLPVVDI